jgi:hypothetical protein
MPRAAMPRGTRGSVATATTTRTSTNVPAAWAVTARAGLRSSWWPCRNKPVLLLAVRCPDRGLMLVAFMITTPPVAG